MRNQLLFSIQCNKDNKKSQNEIKSHLHLHPSQSVYKLILTLRSIIIVFVSV